MHFTTLAQTLALALGATAIPAQSAAVKSVRATQCQLEGPADVSFEKWNTECNVGSGHTWGTELVWRTWQDLCFPLPDHTYALKLTNITEGCRIAVFASPVCDDYPKTGHYKASIGCLWTGGSQYRSYKLMCDH
ncbi:hypothetical protein QBC44DRAFT_308647 [Cladorrhinum sp. PSN332]|nr:hypothetical protein QBC44DRAFT_308647 [Cladorrhinum sp. PSN332]